MSDPLRTLEDYELFLYTLSEQFKSIQMSFTQPNLPRLIAEIEAALGQPAC